MDKKHPEGSIAGTGFEVSEIARRVGGDIIGDEGRVIRGAAPFEAAGPEEITYAATSLFLKKISQAQAGAIIVPKGTMGSDSTLIRVNNPQVAFARAVELIYPPERPAPGISPITSIGNRFVHGEGLILSPFSFVGEDVAMGDRVWIHPGVVLGDGVSIGDDVVIHPNVTIGKGCRIGNRVIIHAGTVIGSDGFGFAPDGGGYQKIPHLGCVQIDDDVEIGANNAIDRGTFGKTWIQRGVKTDNLVHIAHNVTVGEDSLLVAQVGISGSVTIGKHAILAGQAGISGHLKIGDNAIIGPQAGVGKSIPDRETVSGTPEMPHSLWLRVQRTVPRLPEMKKKITEIEKRLSIMERKDGKNL